MVRAILLRMDLAGGSREQTKRCTKCGIEKSFSEFGRRVASTDLLLAQCKACKMIAWRGWKDRVRGVALPAEKTCSACRVRRAASEFYRSKSTADGLYYMCRDCAKRRRMQYE